MLFFNDLNYFVVIILQINKTNIPVFFNELNQYNKQDKYYKYFIKRDLYTI